VKAINEIFPKICIQWEDFAGFNAIQILSNYREKICTFNDDIQGTASVATGGLIAACKFSGKPLGQQRFLFLGAGAAAIGIANLLVIILKQQGISESDAYQQLYLFNSKGLLVSSRTDLRDYQMKFAKDISSNDNFAETILSIKPTAIIGVSTVGGAFTQQVIEAMSSINERPIIFPYSNPTAHSECTAEQAYNWSKGKAIFASGSPFAPVNYNGKIFTPGQGNNVYIFPAMGLAVFATQPRRITDEMFIVASETLAGQVTGEDFENGLIYPPINKILEVSLEIAMQVVKKIFELGMAGINEPKDIASFIKNKMYQPVYS
jgi:malate dehydrogenase (oxaloacetate-decarboxylating)(NADP+)